MIDFAYAIHSAIGNKMVGAKINGMIVPIDRVPQNGEIVEILTSSSSRGPSRDWLKIVKTSEARSKIRQWFKKEKRADNIALGRSMIETELKRFGRQTNEAQRLEIATNVAHRIGIQGADDLYNTIGYGGLSVSKLMTKLRDEFDRVVGTQPEPVPITQPEQVPTRIKPKNIKNNSGIIVDGERGCLVKFAKCCNPLPGDPVIGFITKGFGISIHKQDCPNVRSSLTSPENAARWVEARWDDGFDSRNTDSMFEAHLQIHAIDRNKLLADVSTALADMKVGILNIYTQHAGAQKVILNITVSCKNRGHYDSIVSRIRSIDDVVDVVRGFS